MEERKKDRLRSIGLTVIWVAFAVCAIVFVFLRFSTVWTGVGKVWDALTPFVVGIALCYLVNPMYNKVSSWVEKKTGKAKPAKMAASAVAVFVVLLVIYGVVSLLLPKVLDSVKSLYEKSPEMIQRFLDWYESLKEKEFFFQDLLVSLIQAMIDYADDFVENEITPNLEIIASTVYSSVVSVASFVYDFLIGLIAMVYLLNYKDKLIPQVRRLIYAVTPKYGDAVCEKINLFNDIFGGFISGKLLDSLIIGILCFICLTLFRVPYALLVSVIIGVTNVIPFFGPLIGAIPCAFIILIISPEKGILFIIFIIILQQIDGNLIGPRILGKSIGITSLSVLFSIIVGGGLFGFFGMLLAVPTWAFIKTLLDEAAETRLKKAGLPVEEEAYQVGMNHDEWKTEENNGVEAHE